MKKAIITGALILSATVGVTSATFAHSVRYHRHGYSHEFNRGVAAPDTERGGPGPRVEGGSGTGVGAQR